MKNENRISYNLKLAQYRKIQKRRPSIYKPILFLMALHGNAWQYMTIHGSTWGNMAIHGNTWKDKAIHGYIHGSTWL